MNSKRWMPHLTFAAVFVAGVAFMSIALAPPGWPPAGLPSTRC